MGFLAVYLSCLAAFSVLIFKKYYFCNKHYLSYEKSAEGILVAREAKLQIVAYVINALQRSFLVLVTTATIPAAWLVCTLVVCSACTMTYKLVWVVLVE